MEGYSKEEKARLGVALTDAVRLVIPAAPDAVIVTLHEAAPDNYFRGGQNRDPAPALPDHCQVVRDYLNAMEARDLDKAQQMLGEGFEMTFPGAAPMTRLDELVAWSKPRYTFVRKTYEGFEALQNGTVAVVYARGTLHGEWLDGTAFSDIRFIDRFELAGGKIIRQDVWNDMAEAKGKK